MAVGLGLEESYKFHGMGLPSPEPTCCEWDLCSFLHGSSPGLCSLLPSNCQSDKSLAIVGDLHALLNYRFARKPLNVHIQGLVLTRTFLNKSAREIARLTNVPEDMTRKPLPYHFLTAVDPEKAFSDYQRQLWDPLSVPVGVDMNDVGYARGGAAIDSSGIAPGGCRHGCLEVLSEEGGEWHFHAFGETVGLFALDIGHGSAGLQVST